MKPADNSFETNTSTSALTSDNLRLAPLLAKIDKSQLIGSYIRTQAVHRTFYAHEGKKTAEKWNKTEATNAIDDDDGVEEANTMFGTPMLKPRVPEAPQEKPRAANRDDGRREMKESRKACGERAAVASTGKHDSRDKAEKSTKRKAPDNSDMKHKTLDSTKHKSTNTMDKYVQSLRKNVDVVKNRKRPRSPDSDREALLSERRERRRAKKAIMDPSSRDEDDEGGKSKKKGKKKGKGKNLAAGLALMHGFSATNVGASRLTMKPTFGVFHKGKASDKTKTSSIQRKTVLTGWSENDFLGNTPHETSKNKPRGPNVDDTMSGSENVDSSDASSSHASTAPPKRIKISNYDRKQHPAKTDSLRAKTKAKPPGDSDSDHPLANEGCDSEVHDESECSIPARTRQASIVWDIEMENEDTGKKDATSEPTRGQTPSNVGTRAGTIIVDTRALRWSATRDRNSGADSAGSGPSDEKTPHEIPHALEGQPLMTECNVSYLSLCPSHSASQIGRHPPVALDTSLPQQSSYFAHPEPTQPDIQVATSGNHICDPSRFPTELPTLSAPIPRSPRTATPMAVEPDCPDISNPPHPVQLAPTPTGRRPGPERCGTSRSTVSSITMELSAQTSYRTSRGTSSARPWTFRAPHWLPRQLPGPRAEEPWPADQHSGTTSDDINSLALSEFPDYATADDTCLMSNFVNGARVETHQTTSPFQQVRGQFMELAHHDGSDGDLSYCHGDELFAQYSPVESCNEDAYSIAMAGNESTLDTAALDNHSGFDADAAYDTSPLCWSGLELDTTVNDSRPETWSEQLEPFVQDGILCPDGGVTNDMLQDEEEYLHHPPDQYDGQDADEIDGLWWCEQATPSDISAVESAVTDAPLPNTQPFCEGRDLLRNITKLESVCGMAEEYPTVFRVEEDVARQLQDHWRPQRL